MSKYLKNLMTDELKGKLSGVGDALVVDVIGMEANASVELRRSLREKNMHLMVVKNSLARRATEGTTLAPAFEGATGTSAVVWGGEDVVSLAKESRASGRDKLSTSLSRRRAASWMARSCLPTTSQSVSKWPSREEQLSLLMGQILGPGATLSAQLLGPAKLLASQVKQIGEAAD